MFTINDDLSIYATRGDTVFFTVTAEENGTPYYFEAGDVLRIKIYGKKDASNVVLEKCFPVTARTDRFTILLTEEDTKIGDVISKPTDYWYEIELNPFTNPQTIIGYDEDGAKVFRLFPEGKDSEEPEADPEDIPIVDDELDMTSNRPVQNQAISRAIVNLEAAYKVTKEEVKEKSDKTDASLIKFGAEIGVERERIDNLVSGATADGAEVVDIRVGADGVTYGSAGTSVRAQFNDIKNRLKNGNVITDVTLEATNGYYIQNARNNGGVFANASYSYSKPISVPAGFRVSFTAVGYLTYVGMISIANTDGTYSPVVDSVDSNENTYTYTAEDAVDLVFSWRTANGYKLTVSADMSMISAMAYTAASNAEKAITEADYVSLSLFSKFGVVGDSYASGEMYFNEKLNDIYNVSWGQILARKTGSSCMNFSSGGQTTRSWLTAKKGLPLLLATEAQDIYYLALGINDANSGGEDYLGTINDIKDDYTQNADTFFGNYGKIISNIQNHAPNAKIVMFTIVPNTEMKATYNEAVVKIAEYFGIPYIVQTDDGFFTSNLYTNGMVQSHPVAVVYSGMANAFERLLKKCVIDNFEYFKNAFMH